jgi:hypothetical protein
LFNTQAGVELYPGDEGYIDEEDDEVNCGEREPQCGREPMGEMAPAQTCCGAGWCGQAEHSQAKLAAIMATLPPFRDLGGGLAGSSLAESLQAFFDLTHIVAKQRHELERQRAAIEAEAHFQAAVQAEEIEKAQLAKHKDVPADCPPLLQSAEQHAKEEHLGNASKVARGVLSVLGEFFDQCRRKLNENKLLPESQPAVQSPPAMTASEQLAIDAVNNYTARVLYPVGQVDNTCHKEASKPVCPESPTVVNSLTNDAAKIAGYLYKYVVAKRRFGAEENTVRVVNDIIDNQPKMSVELRSMVKQKLFDLLKDVRATAGLDQGLRQVAA